MRNTIRWATLLLRYTPRPSGESASRTSCRRVFHAFLAGLGALLMAGNLAHAATLHGGDILVVDAGAGKLFQVDPTTGARTVISDFRDPSQGPVDQSFLGGVALGQGRIFVTAATTGIYAVDPATGNRTLVSNFKTGAFQGDVFGAAVDSVGRVLVNWAKPQYGGSPRSIVRVNATTGAPVLLSDLTNAAQGDAYNCCVASFTDLALEHTGAIVAGVTWYTPVGPTQDKGDLYRVDPNTGNRVLLSDFSNAAQGATQVQFAKGIAVNAAGQILITSHATSTATVPRDLVLRIDPSTGNRTVLSDFDNSAQGTTGRRLSGLAIEHGGSGGIIVGASNSANVSAQPSLLFRVDPVTGQRTLLSDSSNAKQGPSFSWVYEISIVPDTPAAAGFFPAPSAKSFASPFASVK